MRCDGLDLASAAEEDGIHAEIPGLEGAYVEFVRLTGGALKVGISRDMAAGEEYSFRPYLLSADGSRHEAASGVRGITPLDPLRRPRGWDEGETSATLVYTIPAPGAEELGGCTLCLRVVCRDALRGTWEIPVELSEGEEPIELRADIRDGDKLYEDVHISLTPLCLRIECLDEALHRLRPLGYPRPDREPGGRGRPHSGRRSPGMDWTAPIQPADYNNPDGRLHRHLVRPLRHRHRLRHRDCDRRYEDRNIAPRRPALLPGGEIFLRILKPFRPSARLYG